MREIAEMIRVIGVPQTRPPTTVLYSYTCICIAPIIHVYPLAPTIRLPFFSPPLDDPHH